ncbi:hypothetical protein DP939_21235 [Spongiactinospora rosea]|uniref:Uncharacterized protein n=1 Tax=Spongiactinospora rosea TaxID=2248750 RepID=A0A366LVC7_9ACTN|nr:hypothetical protein DP939_21235 [Spongiactinospora rosea]
MNLEFQYLGDVYRGLATLHVAAKSSDPATRGPLRQEALGYFKSAARTLGSSVIAVDQVGLFDRENTVLHPQRVPWLSAAAGEVAAGMYDLHVGGGGGSSGPRGPVAAMRHFDEAYKSFTTATLAGR